MVVTGGAVKKTCKEMCKKRCKFLYMNPAFVLTQSIYTL